MAKPDEDGIIRFSPQTIGTRLRYKGSEVIALREEGLDTLPGGRATKTDLIRLIRAKNLLRGGHGDGRTTQLHCRVNVGVSRETTLFAR